MESMETYRKFLRADRWPEWKKSQTDQRKKIPRPIAQEPCPETAKLIQLIEPQNLTVGKMSLIEAIGNRRSRRKYTNESLTLEELSFLPGYDESLTERVSDACLNQPFVGEGAVVFIWTAIPYRAEWRYSIVAHKMIAIDAGHLCQNLYLASEAIGAGTCAIGAYENAKIDAIIGVDGEDEFVIYAAPVGKV